MRLSLFSRISKVYPFFLAPDTVCGDAQVIVATAPMAWGMTAAAQLVVVMGTQARPSSGHAAAHWLRQVPGALKLSSLSWCHAIPLMTDVPNAYAEAA